MAERCKSFCYLKVKWLGEDMDWRWLKKKKNYKDSSKPVLSFDKVVDKNMIKQQTEIIWRCVSMSRSQFKDHYIGTIKNIAVFMQDEVAFGKALQNATHALQGTMMVKLPYDRPREQGAKHEQLWKYAMFVCHLLREASKLNRRWIDSKGTRILFVDLSQPNLQYDDSDTHKGIGMMSNLNQMLPESSSTWLLEDDEKCLVEVTRAASGYRCFIDGKQVVTKEQKNPEDEMLSKVKNRISVTDIDISTGEVVEKESKTKPDDSGAGNRKKINAVEPKKRRKRSKAVKTSNSEQADLFAQKEEIQLSVSEFEEYIEGKIEWKHLADGTKSFPYQSTIQMYLNYKNRKNSSTTEFYKELEKSGYKVIELENKQFVVTPEDSRV